MNRKTTWNWIILAAALFVFIFFFERHLNKPEPAPVNILAGFKSAEVNSVQVRPAAHPEIRADRSNGVWRLTRPISYPAQTTAVESLLRALEKLMPAKYISSGELRQKPNFDAEYGFAEPQFSINIQRGENRLRLLIGSLTAPGDQVFLEVVGTEGVYVVDSDFLKLLPRSTDDWRDTSLVDVNAETFNRLVVATGGKTIELQRDLTNKVWSMVHPLNARADNGRIAEMLQKLQTLRVIRFMADGPDSDLEAFGLQPAELELTLAMNTNAVVQLQFGKSPTNEPGQIFARRLGVGSVVTVSKDLVAQWRAGVNDFRDHHLLTLEKLPEQIEVRGTNSFTVQRGDKNTWKIASEDFPVDLGLLSDFINNLCALEIVQFKDAVTGPDLTNYGLESAEEEIVLRPAPGDDGSVTNSGLQISFGKVQDDTIFARRADEDSIYSIKLADYLQLPTAAWQLRERRLWRFTENEVANLTIRQDSQTRKLVRDGTNSWRFAEGSQGIINPFAIEEAVHRFGELSATAWTAIGDENREKFGFTTNGLTLTFELKDGTKDTVEFGGVSPTQYPYAAATLEGQTRIFEFPFGLYQLAVSYLALKADTR